MTNIRMVFIGLLISASTLAFGQGTDMFETPAGIKPTTKAVAKSDVNKTDEAGRKQGKWEKKYPDGKTAYTAFFKDNVPTGLLIRYHESGKMMARIDYGTSGTKGHAELFDENGKLIAKGNYINNNAKDSIWQFFNTEGKLTAIETYSNGKKNGTSLTYYPNGQLSEETTWKADKKNGKWLQYFNGGEIKLQSQHINDLIHGPYLYYFQNGQTEINGTYYQGLEDGKWQYFNADGTLSNTTEFIKGKPKNPELYEQQQKKMFKELDDNKDNLMDPEKFKENPEAIMKAK